jgi:hypothetical protein
MSDKKPSQISRIYDLLLDGNPHSVKEIIKEVYGLDHCGYPNVHGRITDIRKKYGVKIINFKDNKIKSLTYYQIQPIEFQKIPLEDFPQEPKFEDMPEYDEYNGGHERLIKSKIFN